jgi:hypothetical protein
MLLESSDSRNLAARATSSDVPHRFKSDLATIVSSNPFSWSAGRPTFFIIGVSMREAGLIRSERKGVEMHNTTRCAELKERFGDMLAAIRTTYATQNLRR